jgi:hypothetical protein
MALNGGSIGRRGSPGVTPTKFVGPMREDRLGCVRSIVWIVFIEVVVCVAALAVWLSIH